MNHKRLRRRVRRQAKRELRRGNITSEQYQQCMEVTGSEQGMTMLRDDIDMAGLDPYTRPETLMQGPFMDMLMRVWDWIKKHWPEILAIIMKIAPLLLILDEDNE